MTFQVDARRSPGCAHLQLEGARWATDFAITHGGSGGDGATRVERCRAWAARLVSALVLCGLAEQRVRGDVGVDVGLYMGDHEHLGVLLRVLAVRVVEENASAKG